jgi:hypothetical protein
MTVTDHQEPTEKPAEPPAGEPASERKLSPPLLAALILGAALVVGVGVAGILVGGAGANPPAPPVSTAEATGPAPIVPVDSPQAGSPSCTTLMADMPAKLTDGHSTLHRRPILKPAPPAVAAWGGTATVDPVVLRCGIERPPELKPTVELLEVSGVQWFKIDGDDSATWYAVDRPVVIALTLPAGKGTGPIQDISAAITAALKPVPVF